MTANADYIVTGDRALLGLAEVGNVAILSPMDFVTRVLDAPVKQSGEAKAADRYDACLGTDPLRLALGPTEFLVLGGGVIITFEPRSTGHRYAGILSIDEGEFRDGQWVAGRRLNGDESHQGRHLRIPYGQQGSIRVRLHDYD